MTDDVGRVFTEAAAPPSAPVDVPMLVARARRRRRRRYAGQWLVAVLLVLAAGLLALSMFGPQVEFADTPAKALYPLPDRGTAAPQWLPDGTPIFVAHDLDGRIHVVRAVGRYQDGIDTAVVWCPPSRRFYAEWTATVFEADGSWVAGPGPHGLVTYDAALTDDRRVRVGTARAPEPRRSNNGSVSDPGCWGADGMLDRDVVVDHGWSARPALRPDDVLTGQPHRTVLIRGLYVPELDGTSSLCRDLAGRQPPTCGGRGLRLAVDNEPRDGTIVLDVVARGEWRDGRLYDVLLGAVLAEVAVFSKDAEQREVTEQPGDVRVEDERLIVPAGDIWFGEPTGVVIAGTYEVELQNHGWIRHTLYLEHDPGWALAAEGGRRATGSLLLEPGVYRFYCSVPGHRDAGMEFSLQVG